MQDYNIVLKEEISVNENLILEPLTGYRGFLTDGGNWFVKVPNSKTNIRVFRENIILEKTYPIS